MGSCELSVLLVSWIVLETVLLIWDRLISMQTSSLADDGGAGPMNIIILLGSTNAVVKGIRLKYLPHSGAKLSVLKE